MYFRQRLDYTSYNNVVHYQDSTYLAANAIVKINSPYCQATDIAANIGERFSYQIIIEAKPGKARATIHGYIDQETNDITYSRAAEMTDIDVSKFSKGDKKKMRGHISQEAQGIGRNAESLFKSFQKAFVGSTRILELIF